MTRLTWKVCGITSAADAGAAVAAGADAIGLVFWPRSPRGVTVEAAANIVADVPARVQRVGVFVNASAQELLEASDAAQLDVVQFSGDEPPAAVADAPRPAWKALRLAPGTCAATARHRADAYPDAMLLIDAAVPGAYGGTGHEADWTVAAELAAHRQVMLAGGLCADNVVAAVEHVRPWGVDVSSGVEAAPGRKDVVKLGEFARALESCR